MSKGYWRRLRKRGPQPLPEVVAQRNSDAARVEAAIRHLERHLAKRLDDLARRPVTITLDGKTIARSVDLAKNRDNR